MNKRLFFIITIFLIVNSYSTKSEEDKHDGNREENNKKIEEEIRKAFVQNKIFVTKQLRKNELLCRCNHIGCSAEITDIAGQKYEGICRAHYGGQCRRMVHISPEDGKIKDIVLSCINRDELVPYERPFVCQNVNNSRMVQAVKCCTTKSFCNDEELPIENSDQIQNRENDSTNESIFLYFLSLVGVAVVFAGIGLWIGIFYCSAERYGRVKAFFDRIIDRIMHVRVVQEQQVRFRHSSRLEKLLDDLERTVSTGSGAGMPILAMRTIARQITLKECIGKGGFGEVYVGEWRGEKVAVKIFSSRDESSWQRETDIYRHNMVRHSNLLRWIASDNKDTGTITQLWLITEYMPNGSLFDYLERNKLSLQLMIQFIRSIAHGLAYLHTEVPGVNNQCHKPGIAHRDIKSKNILIKNDWTCCIADLGMAIRYINGEVDIPSQDRGGTVRYLSPEFLANNYNRDSFTSYLQMDIYAFALVIWETLRRVDFPAEGLQALPYEIPYQEYVPREPTPADIYQCVVVDARRPSVQPEWRASKTLAEIVRIMQESWNTTPNSRLTALNIRCSLDRICNEQNLNIIT